LPMPRRKAREQALQALYQIDLTGIKPEEALEALYPETPVPEGIDPFLVKLVYGTTKHFQQLDPLIQQHLIGWDLRRLSVVDRNIMRLALFEMIHLDTPVPVVLDEAVELAKTFSTDEGRRFINGVLSSASRHIQKEALAPDEEQS